MNWIDRFIRYLVNGFREINERMKQEKSMWGCDHEDLQDGFNHVRCVHCGRRKQVN